MAGSIFVRPKAAPISGSGAPYAGAKYTFYLTGTSTLATVYTDSALSVAHSNPVIADANGTFAPIWLDPTVTYRAKLTTTANVLIEDIDPVDNKKTDAAVVAFTQSGTGAVATTVQEKIRKIITDGDYSTSAQAEAAGNSNRRTYFNPPTWDRITGTDCAIVQGSLTGDSIFCHAYTDFTSFTSSTTGGYASYDTTAVIGNGSATHYNHAYGFEARMTWSGSGGIDNFYGFYSGLTINASATNVFGFMAGDPIGSGASTNNIGFYCNDLTKGTNNYGIRLGVTSGANKWNVYSAGSAPNYFAGAITADGAITLNAGGTLGANQKINMSGNSGFHFATDTNILLSGSGTVSTISSINDANSTYEPLQFASSISIFTSAQRQKVYTVATLPSAGATGAGGKAFVSDANSTTFASVVAGGGANIIPVYCDGTNWRIG